ncbi:MAG: ABC transporter ATP-binding protein [Verrucomicrobiales bacterium]
MDARDLRHHCFTLIREVTRKLGWKYKLWIPAAAALSAVHLLPQGFFLFFTEGTRQLSETPATDFIRTLILFGLAVAVAQWIALVLDGILSEWLRLEVSIGLRKDAVVGLSQTRIDALDTAERGDWMTRMTGDLFTAEEFLTSSLPNQITNATMLLGSAALFFYFSGPIAFIPLVAAAFLGWFNILVQRRMAPTLGAARSMEGGVFQSMIETFEGLRTIRSYGSERFVFARIDRQLQSLYKAGMRITKSMAMLMGTNELVGQVVITGLLTLVAYQIRGDSLTAEDALVYPFYIGLFLGAAKSLVSSAYDWNRFFIEGGRLASLLYDDEKKEQGHAERFGDFEKAANAVRSLHAREITIAYGDAEPVIKSGDFTLHRSEIVALMGPSGCGKSTLAESMAGLRRVGSGFFQCELEDGTDRTFPQPPVFLSAFVEQQPYLFVGTIRENIALGDESVSEDALWKALDEVGLVETIRRRGGLDEVLTDRGRNLSVGQQYRLALCRALVCRRPFLMMDEPFAALDVESVERVVRALQIEREKGTGILLITHLLPPDLEADRVVELG